MELQLLSKVQGVPGVTQLMDFYEKGEFLLYVMNKPDSCMDMFDFITKRSRLEEGTAKSFFQQIVNTVIACHSKGVIHRDIKDENILVNLETLDLTLVDFGSGAYMTDEVFTDYSGEKYK